jgi:hypothetical protein
VLEPPQAPARAVTGFAGCFSRLLGRLREHIWQHFHIHLHSSVGISIGWELKSGLEWVFVVP